MNKISKNILILGLVFSLLPVSVFAREDESERGGRFEREGRSEMKRSRGVDFCQNIDAIAAKISSDLGNKDSRFDDRKEERSKKIYDKRTTRDVVREEKRSERDDKHDTRIEALMAKADTDAERAAVEKFKQTLEEATKVRREAIDVAVETFRAGVDKLIKDKFVDMDGDLEAFKEAMDEAIAQAKADCAADKDPKPAFLAAVKAARDNFKTSKPEMIKEEIKKLVDARKASVDAAVNTFKTTMKAAFEELKTAFGGEIE